MQVNVNNKIERAETSLQRELEWIGRHDARVAVISGISIAMLGVIANASAFVKIWSWNFYGVFGLATILLLSSIILVYCSQYPRVKSRNSSVVFFGTVALMRYDEFRKKFNEMDDNEYLEDLLAQIHINAEILNKKFSYLKASLVVLMVAIIPWLVAIYISKLYI